MKTDFQVGLAQKEPGKTTFKEEVVGNGIFWIYIYFIIDFFLHFSARIPGYGIFRPTLLMIAILTVALFAKKSKLKGYGSDPVTQSLLVLFVYIFITLPLVEWPGSVVRHNFPEFVKAIVFFFFTSLIIDSERQLKILLVAFVGCQVFRALEPLYLHITSGYWGSYTHIGGGEFAGRLAGAPTDIINPNELGFLIVTVIPFLHYFLWSGGFIKKVMYMGLLPPLLYALTLTLSRGALIALGVVAWMIFQQSKMKVPLVIAGIIGVVVMWANLNDLQKDRYLSLVSDDTAGSVTVDGRLTGMWEEFLIGLERPIVGHGVGTSAEAKAHHGRRPKPSHNFYAELFVEIGIIGFILFMRFFKNIWKKLKLFKEQLAIALKENEKRKKLAKPAQSIKMTKPGKAKKGKETEVDSWAFFKNLNMSLTAVFWMYIVYSFNYYGLSVYYWYFFGGLVLAASRIVDRKSQAMPEPE